MIEYYVSSQPQSHIFTVKMVIEKPDPQLQSISMGKWIPGSYLIRDYARHVIAINVQNGQISKHNSNTWIVASAHSPLVIEYMVYAFDFSVRGAYIDDERAFLNGINLFMQVHGQEQSIHRVYFQDHWKWATTLPLKEKSATQGTIYEIDGYDALIDHPLQAGKQSEYTFKVEGISHCLVINSEVGCDYERLIDDIKKILHYQINLFGKPTPFKDYLFLLTVRKEAYGGLEHRSSSALQCSPECLPKIGKTEKTTEYINLLSLISHEYFHSWNVKKIKPQAFTPYNLDHKAYTRQLWIFEGITSYYDNLVLVRAGVITPKQYFNIIAQNITKLMCTPGRKHQTLVESSFDTWIKFYQPNENTHNATVSYYLKGGLAALLLDLVLRITTQQCVSFDTLMQYLWREYGESQKGVPEDAVEKYLAKLGGEKISALIHQAIHTVEELPLAEWFSYYGLRLTFSSNPEQASLWGVLFTRSNGKLLISTVFEKSAAQQAGLCPQDEVIAFNKERIEPEAIEKQLSQFSPGEKIIVTLCRQGRLQEREVILQAPEKNVAQITIKEMLTGEEKNNLKQWLLHECNPLS